MLLVFLSIFMHLIRSRERSRIIFHVVNVPTKRINLRLEIWLGLLSYFVHSSFPLCEVVFIFIVMTHIDKVDVNDVYLF